MAVRIVVLTSGTALAERALLQLGLRDVVPDALILAGRRSAGTSRVRRARQLARRPPGDLARAVVRRAGRALESADERWPALAREVHAGLVLNSPEFVARLQSLEPDYLVLLGAGIVKAETLAVPRRGTLNFHPALLPWVPGVGVVERSIERAVAVGTTAHFVDEGIDTGPLIRREIVPVHEHDTLRTIRDKVDERTLQITAELVSAAAAGDELHGAVQSGAGEYSRWPSADEIAAVEQAVADGAAVRHFHEWTRRFGGLVLPAEAAETA